MSLFYTGDGTVIELEVNHLHCLAIIHHSLHYWEMMMQCWHNYKS